MQQPHVLSKSAVSKCRIIYADVVLLLLSCRDKCTYINMLAGESLDHEFQFFVDGCITWMIPDLVSIKSNFQTYLCVARIHIYITHVTCVHH